MKKTRTIQNDKYELKKYIKEVKLEEVKEILKVRLHMTTLPANYRNLWTDPSCPLCNVEEGTSEHYLKCPNVSYIAKVWEIKEDDLNDTSVEKMVNVAKYMNKVEIMLGTKNNSENSPAHFV